MEERKTQNCENPHNATYTEILKNKKIERTRSKNQKKNIIFLKYIDGLKKQQFKQAGITLVALVVTVIVLLILAGVTISLALGSNGVMDKAQYASNTWANATKDETLMYTEIDENIEELSDSNSIVIIDSNGKKIKMANIAYYYGHNVSYNNQIFQLFYVDTTGKYSNGKPGVWIQLNEYKSGIKLSDHYETTGISDLNSILWQINPELKEKYGEIISSKEEANQQNNIKAVAYLTNPENWNSTYVAEGDTDKGVYAIGGVSAEMYCDSYNQAREKTNTDVDFFDIKVFNANDTYGYLYKPYLESAAKKVEDFGSVTDYSKYEIKITTNKSIYRPENKKWPWIASPSAVSPEYVCFMDGRIGALNNKITTHGGSTVHGVRPAVFLPSKIEINLIN